MDKKTYEQIEAYMKSCMQDSAHDVEHIYRVLYTCLLYTSDAADYTPCVYLGGRRIIKKKKFFKGE